MMEINFLTPELRSYFLKNSGAQIRVVHVMQSGASIKDSMNLFIFLGGGDQVILLRHF